MTTMMQRTGQILTTKTKRRAVGLEFNLAEVVADLGDIPLDRIRMKPIPGTATVNDVAANNDSKTKTAIVELVDGTLVEKPMGAKESEAAYEFGGLVRDWNKIHDLGIGLGADGVVRLFEDSARAPDFAFYCYDQFPDGKFPNGQIPWMYPDLAVEVLSPSNSKREMAKKRREYFAAGTRLVWEVDLNAKTVVVYREPNRGEKLLISDTLDGEDVLPGFKLPLRKWFNSLKLS